MKRVTLTRAQKQQATRQKIDSRNYVAYEVHKKTIIIENAENPSAFFWDMKSLKWIKDTAPSEFRKFAVSGRAEIPDNAPSCLAAKTSLELVND